MLPRVAVVLLATVVLGATAPAEAQGRRAYVTELGRRALAGVDQIVDGKVARLLPQFRGVSAARIEVTARLHGYDRKATLTVLYVNDYVAPDAFRATIERRDVALERERKRRLGRVSAPEGSGVSERDRRRNETAKSTDLRRGAGVRLAQGEAGLFFLKRRGASYTLYAMLPKRDPFFDAKRRRLVATLDLERGGSIISRAKRAKRYFLDAMLSRDPWERGHAARELRAMAERYRAGLFDRTEGEQLLKLLYDEREPPILSSLERAVRAIDPSLVEDWARRTEQAAVKRAAPTLDAARKRLERTKVPEVRAADLATLARQIGRGSTPLLIEGLKDPAPVVRERVAQAMAELSGPSANEPLRDALRKERDANAIIAMMYACGVKGDPEAVPLLAERLEDPRFEAAGLTALARIGTEPARSALLRYRNKATEDTRKLIDRLIEEEFPDRP